MPLHIERDVPCPLRDGTVLRADVFRPEGPGPFPVVLMRTPYDKAQMALPPERLCAAGYAVVRQDTRGRFASEGHFEPFRADAADGYDAVAWAAAQPWSDGRVALAGPSYLGFTQWAAARAAPSRLVTLMPDITSGDPYAGFAYSGGAFQLHFLQCWALNLAADLAARRGGAVPEIDQFAQLRLTQMRLNPVGGPEALAAAAATHAFVLRESAYLP